MLQLTDCAAQSAAVARYFDTLGAQMDRLPEPAPLPQDGGSEHPLETTQ
jgi:tRNA-dihydrouridine synthase B